MDRKTKAAITIVVAGVAISLILGMTLGYSVVSTIEKIQEASKYDFLFKDLYIEDYVFDGDSFDQRIMFPTKHIAMEIGVEFRDDIGEGDVVELRVTDPNGTAISKRCEKVEDNLFRTMIVFDEHNYLSGDLRIDPGQMDEFYENEDNFLPDGEWIISVEMLECDSEPLIPGGLGIIQEEDFGNDVVIHIFTWEMVRHD